MKYSSLQIVGSYTFSSDGDHTDRFYAAGARIQF
jgi:hypothetical protein